MLTDMNQLNNQHALVELLNALMTNQKAHMSTLDLLSAGILSPAAGIARLKEHGVIFETIYQSVVDKSGRVRKRVACYKIVGGVVL